jgi:type IV pilus assembly protein PilA
MIKMIQKNMNKKGFTLVELIIVIAVMAILAAIVVPRMSGITTTFKKNADERVCANYAREIEVSIQSGSIDPAATGFVFAGSVDDFGTISVDKRPQSVTYTAQAATDIDDYRYLIINASGIYTVYVYADAANLSAANQATVDLADAALVSIPSVKVIKVEKIN